jgi:IS30 family transposase
MSEVALHESRQGIDLTYGELEVMEAKTAPLLKQGLSPYVIYRTIGDELPVLERSFYRYVEKHYLAGIRATDLPEKMKRRPRRHGKKASSRTNIAKEELSGRTYADFMALPEGVKALAVEGDCVCGIKSDSKVLLTLFWRSSSVQLMLPMGRQDSDHVKAQFDILERILGDDFPAVILLDRGSEFARASALETSCLNEGKRCHVYYCDPMRADQKGACERNHRFIRRIIPKGTSLERISRRDAARLMSHVNSLPRRSLGGISPIAAARDILPQALFEAYGIEEIKVAQIVLKPSLIGL